MIFSGSFGEAAEPTGVPDDIARIIEGLQDPEAGRIGQELTSKLKASKCEFVEQVTPESYGNVQTQQFAPSALYTPFTYDWVEPKNRKHGALHPFFNSVSINQNSPLQNRAISTIHEGAHVLAWNNTPILHASPYNGENAAKPYLVLCPRDWIRIVILTEQDAFAKQAWLASRAAKADDAFYAGTITNPTNAQTFELISSYTDNLTQALVRAANHAVLTWHHDDLLRGEKVPFMQHYIENALEVYEGCNRLKNTNGITFVQMDDDDLIRVGETIGPNLFTQQDLIGLGDLDQFIPPKLRERYLCLLNSIGLYNESLLPTFKDALSEQGLTPDEFLAISKGTQSPNTSCEHFVP